MTNRRPLRELDPHIKNGRLRFVCPACCVWEEGRPIGHMVLIAFGDGEPLEPDDPVWELVRGSTADDLTLSPSIDATASGSCGFHGYVTDGIVTW